MSSALVLLSGGLDSSFNLWQAHKEMKVKLAITFNYGQRAAAKEIASAQKQCELLKVSHEVIELPWFQKFTNTALVNQKEQVPSGHEVKIDDLKISQQTASSVWIPNRNGILLNIAAGFAEALKCDYIIPGFNLEEATTFPDNSKDYLKALDRSFHFSTANKLKTFCFSQDLTKSEIIKMAINFKWDWQQLWPCYLAHDKWCGQCESCQRFKRALSANQINLDKCFLN